MSNKQTQQCRVGFFSGYYFFRTKSSTYAGVRLAGSRHKNVLAAEPIHMAHIPFFSLSSATFFVSRLKFSQCGKERKAGFVRRLHGK